jgi:hypothetical protein
MRACAAAPDQGLHWSARSGRKRKRPECQHPEDYRAMSHPKTPPKQLLHLVFGGELTSLHGIEFRDLRGLDIVGIYPNYAEAYAAWKGAAQRTVDNALMRYFIVHMHRLLDPEHPETADAKAKP